MTLIESLRALRNPRICTLRIFNRLTTIEMANSKNAVNETFMTLDAQTFLSTKL